MKTLKLFLAVGMVAGLAAAFTFPDKKAKGIVWKNTTYDFKTIKMGPDADALYTFTNKTKAEVSITAVQPGCGCTTGDYTKTPIGKNKKGFVKLTYHTKDRPGTFTKHATVTFSDGTTQQITFNGTVTTE